VTSENIARKQKNSIDMVYTIVDNVRVVCTWSVCISKYGRCGYAKKKNNNEIWKNQGWLVMIFGCISKYGNICIHSLIIAIK
jgi:hypothetical protein